MEFSRSPARCVSKALCEQGSPQVRHALSMLFIPKKRGFMGIFWVPKDAQKTGCKSAGWPSYLFGADMGRASTRDGFGRATRGPAEQCFLRERSQETLFRDFEIRKKLVCCPHFSEMGRTLSCRYRIARGEQALLAVSVVLSLARWPACSPHLQRGLKSC